MGLKSWLNLRKAVKQAINYAKHNNMELTKDLFIFVAQTYLVPPIKLYNVLTSKGVKVDITQKELKLYDTAFSTYKVEIEWIKQLEREFMKSDKRKEVEEKMKADVKVKK